MWKGKQAFIKIVDKTKKYVLCQLQISILL